MKDLHAIARYMRLPEDQLKFPIELLNQGYEPNYLANYRPDELGNIDEQTLSILRRALNYSSQLKAHKEKVQQTLDREQQWNETVASVVSQANTISQVDTVTRHLRARKNSRTVSEKCPQVETVGQAILTMQGDVPKDMLAWVAEVASVGGEVQRIDRVCVERGVGVGERRAANHRHGRAVGSKLSREALDLLDRHASLLGDLRGSVVARLGGLVQHRGHGHREQTFSPGLARDELVRVGGGLCQARIHVDELRPPARTRLAHAPVGHTLGDRGVPRAEEVRAERDDVVGVLEIDRRHLVRSKRDGIGAPQDFVREKLVRHGRLGAESL